MLSALSCMFLKVFPISVSAAHYTVCMPSISMCTAVFLLAGAHEPPKEHATECHHNPNYIGITFELNWLLSWVHGFK